MADYNSAYTGAQIDTAVGLASAHAARHSAGGADALTLTNLAGTLSIAKGGTGATTAAAALTKLGLTASAAELNYMDGVTSNVQTQLNGKAASAHTHSYAGAASAGGAATTALTCTGNAATATKLATARTIDGVSFNGTANIVTRLRFANTSVAASAFAADATYTEYPFRAAVALSGVTAAMTPEVVFSCADAASGSFAPVAACYAGGVYIYASSAPNAATTIPTITCWK